jgi:hypothetical protein
VSKARNNNPGRSLILLKETDDVNTEKKPQPARNDVPKETGENADRERHEEVSRAKRKELEVGKQAEG